MYQKMEFLPKNMCNQLYLIFFSNTKENIDTKNSWILNNENTIITNKKQIIPIFKKEPGFTTETKIVDETEIHKFYFVFYK